jgi:hypothetical protein
MTTATRTLTLDARAAREREVLAIRRHEGGTLRALGVAGLWRPGQARRRTMSTIDLRALGLVCGLLALAACESVPAYDESLGWFSRSDYDPEIKAIERRIPPPEGSAAVAPASGAAAVGEGGLIVQSAWMPGLAEPVERETRAARAPVVRATLPARERIAPVGGYASSKRVLYGTNRGPYSSGDVRTLR